MLSEGLLIKNFQRFGSERCGYLLDAKETVGKGTKKKKGGLLNNTRLHDGLGGRSSQLRLKERGDDSNLYATMKEDRCGDVGRG